MKTGKQIKGSRGEEEAVKYLENRGYIILDRNYRFRRSEIDIICQKGNMLVFVEVKTRGTTEFGMPESFLTDNQEMKIYEASQQYIEEISWDHLFRFDIIAIVWDDKSTPDIFHIEDGF